MKKVATLNRSHSHRGRLARVSIVPNLLQNVPQHRRSRIKHRAVNECRLSVHERSGASYFRGAKVDDEKSGDAKTFAAVMVASLLMLSCWNVAKASDATAGKATLAYSFVRNGGGGIAQVHLDEASGKFTGERIVLESAECKRPEKLRRNVDRNLYVLTNETDKDEGPHLFVVPDRMPQTGNLSTSSTSRTTAGPGPAADAVTRTITLPATPDEIRLHDSDALLTCDGDWLVCVDVANAVIRDKWNTGKIVDPPANGPQDLRFLQDAHGKETVIVSFQKDSRKGKKKGSRIVAFRWPTMETIADSALPRSRPDLHIPGNKKESGPGPEIVHVSPQRNRILTTLDLYGAVAIGSLDTFLNGDEVAWNYLSTSTDGSWGDSFPDRMTTFELQEKEVALVANSGRGGGRRLGRFDR